MTVGMLSDADVVGLNVEAVSAWLAELGLGIRPPLRLSRLGNGHSNLTFLATDADERRCVLRRPPLGDLLASAHDVAREFRILSLLEATEVPAPRTFGLCGDDRISQVPLMAMEYVDGIVVDDAAAAEAISTQQRRAIGLALVDALARIHEVDLERTGLVSLASHSPYAERQLKRWHRQWQLSRTRELPAVDELADRLRAAMPAQRELTLVHGDFHLRNVVTSPSDGSVRAVLDWELCTLGDPIADLGGLLAYSPSAGEPATAGITAWALPGFPSRGELAAAYAERSGRSIETLDYWHTLALWKVAIIGEGVWRRARDDPRNAAQGVPVTAETVDELVAQALRVAEDAGL
jgi:aminoglycoside phosphotransferase (APT) family kinase protein